MSAVNSRSGKIDSVIWIHHFFFTCILYESIPKYLPSIGSFQCTREISWSSFTYGDIAWLNNSYCMETYLSPYYNQKLQLKLNLQHISHEKTHKIVIACCLSHYYWPIDRPELKMYRHTCLHSCKLVPFTIFGTRF